MKTRKVRGLSNIILNGILLIFVAALLVVTVQLVRIKLLQNAQNLGMALVQSYVVEEEKNIDSLKVTMEMAGQYVDEIISNGGSDEDIQGWLLGYFEKLTSTMGEGMADFYAVVDGKIVAANPWEGDSDYPYAEKEWYVQALKDPGEAVCGNVYTDAVTGQKVFTISKALSQDGNVLAMDVYIENPQLHDTLNALPEECSYYLCAQDGTLIYSLTKWDTDPEAFQRYADYLMEGIKDGSLLAYDASFQDIDGIQRGVYYQTMENGWTGIMTIPISSILMGEENTIVWGMAAMALLLFLVLSFMTIQDFLHSRRMRVADETAHMLGDSFYAIYRINFCTGTYTALKLHESLKGIMPPNGSYSVFLDTMRTVVSPSTFRAFETSFSLGSIRRRISLGISDHGGDYQRRFGEAYRWVNVRTLYNPEVAPEHVILCFRDVDEEKRQELQHTIILQNALDAAQKSTKSRSEFFSRMSHDMRTPLNAVIGFCDMAERSFAQGDQEKGMSQLKKLSFAGKQLLGLINDILELSRMEAGKDYLEEQKLDLEELLTDTAEMFRERIQEEGKKLEVSVDFTDRKVLADGRKINQIVNNLLSNALKYSDPEDTIRLQARQFYFEQHSKFQIVVEDTGIGMSPEFLEHLFEPYTRETAFTSRAVAGTGLGMPIVKSLVQQMSGEIYVESELGKGSRFTITLPLKVLTSGEEPEKMQNGETEGTFNWEGRKILVAEDNELNREILAAVLNSMGIQVVTAADGMEAVQLFAEQKPYEIDVILMDMQMPKMDGCQAAIAIRQMQREDAKDVPIIAVTANAFAEDIDKTTKAGMNGHVSKPIDNTVLSQTMKKLVIQRERKLF